MSGRASSKHLPAFFDTRFPQETESVDGILCWDLFDYLDRRRPGAGASS